MYEKKYEFNIIAPITNIVKYKVNYFMLFTYFYRASAQTKTLNNLF